MPTILRGIVLVSLLIVSGGGAAAQAMPSGGSDNMPGSLIPFLVLIGVALLEWLHVVWAETPNKPPRSAEYTTGRSPPDRPSQRSA